LKYSVKMVAWMPVVAKYYW